MNSVWNKFIAGYCKVDFLCVNNDPTWLGWIPLIGIAVLFFILIGGTLVRVSETKQGVL